MWQYNNTDELYHYGILGMKWGVRKYQNKDGSITPAGKKRYADKRIHTIEFTNPDGSIDRATIANGRKNDNRTTKLIKNGTAKVTKTMGQYYKEKDDAKIAKDRKKISKTYKKLSEKANKEVSKKHNDMYVDAYNKAADDMNNGGISKFNKQQEKKYGKNFTSREGYRSDYEKIFESKISKYYNQSLTDLYVSNKNYKKAESLVEKYKMLEWDELAKTNTKKYK